MHEAPDSESHPEPVWTLILLLQNILVFSKTVERSFYISDVMFFPILKNLLSHIPLTVQEVLFDPLRIVCGM